MNNKFFELPEEKRMHIVNGALKQFAKMGYRKASTQDIAKECGISKSLLFHYFESKIDLFCYLYRYAFDLAAKSLAGFQYVEDEDIFEMIRRANLIKLELFKAFPYLYKFLYKAYYEPDEDVLDIVKEKNIAYLVESVPRVTKYMDKSRLKEGITPEKAIQIILWVSEGFLQTKLEMDSYEPDTLFKEYNEWMDLIRLCLYQS